MIEFYKVPLATTSTCRYTLGKINKSLIAKSSNISEITLIICISVMRSTTHNVFSFEVRVLYILTYSWNIGARDIQVKPTRPLQYSVLEARSSGVSPFTSPFLKLQYLRYNTRPIDLFLGLVDAYPHCGFGQCYLVEIQNTSQITVRCGHSVYLKKNILFSELKLSQAETFAR